MSRLGRDLGSEGRLNFLEPLSIDLPLHPGGWPEAPRPGAQRTQSWSKRIPQTGWYW
jgi:hypothetical protein